MILRDPRVITFDCWSTLIRERDTAAGVRMRTELVAAECGIGPDEAAALVGEAWIEHVDAWTRLEQYGSPGVVRFLLARHMLSEESQQRLLTAYEEVALTTGIEMVPGADETLRAVKEAGLATALVCDTGLTPGRVVRRLLESVGLDEWLDAMIFSDEVGVPKPHGRMFAAALDAVGGGHAVHVGDIRRTDIAGARNAGLGAVRFRGIHDDVSDHPEGHAVIDDLRELPGLLGLPA